MSIDSIADFVLSWSFLAFTVFVALALFAHLRGRTHYRFMREIFGPATLLAPINVPIYLASAVPAKPFLDIDLIPGLRLLEEHWQELRAEAEKLNAGGEIRAAEDFSDAGFNSFFRRGWKRFYLFWYGEPLPSAQALCPRTLELLAQVPAMRAAMFVRMSPRSRLPVHRDPFAGSLRFHLGLKTPNSEDCFITVDGEKYWWKDGEGVLFDETFLHRARNATDEDRIILFCDVERPLRSKLLRAFNRLVGRTLMRGLRTANVPGEEVGAINRLFNLLYPVRVASKRIKKWNKPLYYVAKYAVVVGIVYLLFSR